MPKPSYCFDISSIRTFADVPQLVSSTNMWGAQYDWKSIDEWYGPKHGNVTIELEPDFQRGRVWTKEQQRAYIEYCLRGGRTGRDIYFNQIGKLHNLKEPYVCVDGLQRMTAIKMFMSDKVKVFGDCTCSSMIAASKNKKFPIQGQWVYIHVNNLQARSDVLRWYLEMNGGGTPHSAEELERVRKLLRKEERK